jgi:hypothetical protein
MGLTHVWYNMEQIIQKVICYFFKINIFEHEL